MKEMEISFASEKTEMMNEIEHLKAEILAKKNETKQLSDLLAILKKEKEEVDINVHFYIHI